jgi:hypothetical protein
LRGNAGRRGKRAMAERGKKTSGIDGSMVDSREERVENASALSLLASCLCFSLLFLLACARRQETRQARRSERSSSCERTSERESKKGERGKRKPLFRSMRKNDEGRSRPKQ